MTGPTFVSSTFKQGSAPLVPAVPASTAAGNLLVAFCWNTQSSGFHAPDGWSAPAGWTQRTAWTGNGPVAIFYKYAAASETAPSFSPTYLGTAQTGGTNVVAVLNYGNPAASSPIRAVGYTADAAANNHVTPSLTASAGDTLIAAAMWSATHVCSGDPAGMTQRVAAWNGSTFATLYAYDQAGLVAGATGTKTIVENGSGTGYSVSLLLAAPAVAYGHVVVGGAKKNVAAASVIVGGVKKPVVAMSVIVGGVKKPLA